MGYGVECVVEVVCGVECVCVVSGVSEAGFLTLSNMKAKAFSHV